MTPDWVLGVDPGGTTGYALIWSVDDPLATLTSAQAPPEAFLRRTVEWLQATAGLGTGLLAVERFTITPNTARLSPQYDALETIGALKFLARQFGVHLVLQTPAQAKRFATNDHLKAWRVYDPKLVHGNDAARHALFALMNAGVRDWYVPTI